MTLTKEWLQQTIAEYEANRDELPFGLDTNSDIELQAFKLALASIEAEPVAWIVHARTGDQVTTDGGYVANAEGILGLHSTPLYTAPPEPVSVPDYPETLPCPVMLEPGLRFGKGVNTRTMLGALQRRAEYYAELEAMTPEQRAEHDADMKGFAAMLQGAETVTTDCKLRDAVDAIRNSGIEIDADKILAERDALNSPVIPDGWVMVPKDPTMSQELAGYKTLNDTGKMSRLMKTRLSNIYRAMLSAAPQQEDK